MAQKKKFPEGLLVSKKFYSDIVSRVTAAFAAPTHKPLLDEALKLIDSYLCGEACDPGAASEMVRVVFTLLKPEFERAMARSLRARKAGAIRRRTNALIAIAKGETVEPTPDLPLLNRRQRRALQRDFRRSMRRQM